MCTSPKAPWLIFLICFVLASPPQVQEKSSSRIAAASPWPSGGSKSMAVSPCPATVKVYSIARFVLDRALFTFIRKTGPRGGQDTIKLGTKNVANSVLLDDSRITSCEAVLALSTHAASSQSRSKFSSGCGLVCNCPAAPTVLPSSFIIIVIGARCICQLNPSSSTGRYVGVVPQHGPAAGILAAQPHPHHASLSKGPQAADVLDPPIRHLPRRGNGNPQALRPEYACHRSAHDCKAGQ